MTKFASMQLYKFANLQSIITNIQFDKLQVQVLKFTSLQITRL
jgi:hypothetical protein